MLRASCLIVPALALNLAGCAALGTPIPSTKQGLLNSFKPIRNSAKAPCEMQRDVAAHNSVYDSLQNGREVIYKAPCDLTRKTEVRGS